MEKNNLDQAAVWAKKSLNQGDKDAVRLLDEINKKQWKWKIEELSWFMGRENMTILICKKHGPTSPAFVSNAIHRDIVDATNKAIGVRNIQIELFDGLIEEYSVDESFIKEALASYEEHIDTVVFKDDMAEDISSKVRPVCGLCLVEYLA